MIQLDIQDHLNMCDITKEYMRYWIYFNKHEEYYCSEDDKFNDTVRQMNKVIGAEMIVHDQSDRKVKTELLKKKPMESDLIKNTYISLLKYKDKETAKNLVIQSIKKETEKWKS